MTDRSPLFSQIANMEDAITSLEGAKNVLYALTEDIGEDEMLSQALAYTATQIGEARHRGTYSRKDATGHHPFRRSV